jgi:hypothetical protein
MNGSNRYDARNNLAAPWDRHLLRGGTTKKRICCRFAATKKSSLSIQATVVADKAVGALTKMIAHGTQAGQSIDQAIDWAAGELEGFMRT